MSPFSDNPNVGQQWHLFLLDHLVDVVVRRPPREQKILGLNPACAGIFSGSSLTSDLNLALQWLPCQAPGVIGSTLGLFGLVSVYCDWVRWKIWSATSVSVWQHVSILWLGEMENLICNFYLSVAAHKIVWADLSLRYTRMLLGC